MQKGLLKYGISGFWMAGHNPPPVLARKFILSAAHAAARDVRWTIGEVHWAEHVSFHHVEVANNADRLAILFNANYPIVAFSKPIPIDYPQPDFVDVEDLADAFRSTTDFHPWSTDVLSISTNAADLTQLNDAEMDQIRYWKPDTIGEIVFNTWD